MSGAIAFTVGRSRVHEDELEEKFVLASGPGGQNVNKVATAVQLRFALHRASGLDDRVKSALYRQEAGRIAGDGTLLIEARRFRSQERNRADARARLAAMIERAGAPPPPPRKATKPTRGAVERRLKAKAIRKDIKGGRGRYSGENGD